MSLILSGTEGLSDVDGTAATPAIRGTDTNTGIFFPAADTIAFAEGGVESMRLDSNGNVGIGTTSPGQRLTVASADAAAIGLVRGASFGVRFGSAAGNGAYVEGVDTTGVSSYQPLIVGGSILQFATGGSERARINSDGSFLYRCTAVPNVSLGQTGFSVTQNEVVFSSDTGTTISYWRTSSGAGRFALSFWNGTSNVGNIALNTTSTTYNTSSDYRLKHDIAPMTGALARVAALKPVTYKWNADNSNGEGFIAHELAEVCPDAVTGEKDAVDKNGNPVYQGIDTSFLVATLTAAIQELKAIVDAQAVEIAALKGQA